jgi:hypothetical protein
VNERDPDADVARYADDAPDSVVGSGLRSLREQTASEASRRATLAALGVSASLDEVPPRVGLRAFALWTLLGLALTLASLALSGWLRP